MASETTTATLTKAVSIPFYAGKCLDPTDTDNDWSETYLNYYKDASQSGPSLEADFTEHEQRVQRRSDDAPNIEKFAVRIRKIKGQEDQYRIETHGFAVGQLDSGLPVRDFDNDDELR